MFKKKSLFWGILMVLLVCSVFINIKPVFAASKKAVYYGVTTGGKKTKKNPPRIRSIRFSNGKLIVTGSLRKAKDDVRASGKGGTLLRYKKRTFKLAKKVKCLACDEECYNMPRKEFVKTLNTANQLGLYIFTNKAGKVYKLIGSP